MAFGEALSVVWEMLHKTFPDRCNDEFRWEKLSDNPECAYYVEIILVTFSFSLVHVHKGMSTAYIYIYIAQ